MPDSSQLSTEPIRLHFRDQRRVVVTPGDEDRFVTTATEAARACQQAQDAVRWRSEFDRFLTLLFDWCSSQREAIAKAYLTFSPEGLELFVLTRGSDYRFDVDDVISKLDIDLAQQFPRCPTEITQLPETSVDSLHAFLDPGKSLEVYSG